LIVKLMERDGAGYRSVGQQLGMSSKEVARRHRAALALSQMEQHDEYGPLATPEMHGLFQEAFATTPVRDWLRWDDTIKKFIHQDNTEQFYEWITGSETGKRKLLSISDVRRLRPIVQNPAAVSQLSDPELSLDEVVASLQAASGSSNRPTETFESAIRQAASVIRDLPAATVQSLSESQLILLEELRDSIDRLVEIHGRLQ
jgi:hypothetical protein